MVGNLLNMNFYFPKLAGSHIYVLLYADYNAATLSRTPIDPKRALKALIQYWEEDQLELRKLQSRNLPKGPKQSIHHRYS